jgi:hypothetical protein
MRVSEQERAADREIDSLALQARRGDEAAESQIGEHEKSCAAALTNRRRLQAARASIEAEINIALATADREAARERAREAKKLLEEFRQLGVETDDGVRKLLANYARLHSMMAEFDSLGVTRISGEVVKANLRRALRTSFIQVRQDLEIPSMPPLERRTFGDVIRAWAASIQQGIARADPPEAPAPTPPVAPIEQQAGA